MNAAEYLKEFEGLKNVIRRTIYLPLARRVYLEWTGSWVS